MDRNLRKTQNLNRRRNETENNRGDYYDGDKNPSVFFGDERNRRPRTKCAFCFGIEFLQKKQKAFVGFFFFFFWVWEELKLERDGEILGFCFSGRNSIRALSIVLSGRERGEIERERGEEREI